MCSNIEFVCDDLDELKCAHQISRIFLAIHRLRETVDEFIVDRLQCYIVT